MRRSRSAAPAPSISAAPTRASRPASRPLDADAVEVRQQAWPDVRDADSFTMPFRISSGCRSRRSSATRNGRSGWTTFASQRAGIVCWRPSGEGTERRAVVTAERSLIASTALGEGCRFERAVEAPAGAPSAEDADAAARDGRPRLVRGGRAGPDEQLARRMGLAPTRVESAAVRLEADGVVLRGRFTPGVDGEEVWCERRLLARIHHLTLGRLRREIDPVRRPTSCASCSAGSTRSPTRASTAATGSCDRDRPAPRPRSCRPRRGSERAASARRGVRPGLLDDLCFSGVTGDVLAARRRRRGARRRGRRRRGALRAGPETGCPVGPPERCPAPTRAAPPRARAPRRARRSATVPDQQPAVSHAARDVAAFLAAEGASFTADIARRTGLLPTATEERSGSSSRAVSSPATASPVSGPARGPETSRGPSGASARSAADAARRRCRSGAGAPRPQREPRGRAAARRGCRSPLFAR